MQKNSLLTASESGQQDQKLEHKDKIHKEEPWRFVNMVVFFLVSLVNGLPIHTFTPINSIVIKVFGYSKVAIAANTLMFPISHPVFAFLANWILDKYGLRIGCSFGIVCLVAGVWLRIFIVHSLVPVIIGSALASLGNIFIINSPSKFASTWFRPSVVARITAIGVLFTMASMGMGVVIPPLFVNESSSKQQIQKMVIIEAIIITVPCILFLFLFKNKPKNPPSFAAEVQPSKSYLQDLKTLFKNKNYLILLLSISLAYGCLSCFTTIVEYLVLPFKYEQPEKLASSILLVAMAVGGVSSVVFIIILKRTKAYKKILMFAMIGACIEMVCLLFTFNTHKLWLVFLITAQLGFFFVPQIPVFLDFGCEVAFPIGEASSSGYLIAGGQLGGFLTGFAAINFLDGHNTRSVYIVMICLSGMLLLGTLAMFFIKEDLKRTRYETGKLEEIEKSSEF